MDTTRETRAVASAGARAEPNVPGSGSVRARGGRRGADPARPRGRIEPPRDPGAAEPEAPDIEPGGVPGEAEPRPERRTPPPAAPPPGYTPPGPDRWEPPSETPPAPEEEPD